MPQNIEHSNEYLQWIPFVEKVNPDLEDYVTKMALKGLFMIAKEEKKIRENPMARVTDMLKRS